MSNPSAVFLDEPTGPCEAHDWPTPGLAKRLVEAMKERHGKGSFNACLECLVRAKGDAAEADHG